MDAVAFAAACCVAFCAAARTVAWDAAALAALDVLAASACPRELSEAPRPLETAAETRAAPLAADRDAVEPFAAMLTL